MFGYACRETPELMPLPIAMAHSLMRCQRNFRSSAQGSVLGPDAKAQVTAVYQGGKPIGLNTVVLSTQLSHDEILRQVNPEGADAFRPARIIERLNLRRPIFRSTATFGHFGRDEFPWEQ